MNISKLRTVLISALVSVCSIGAVQAQTISVNGASCPGATVTYGAGTIAINTSNCSVVATPPTVTGTPPAGNTGVAYNYTFTATGSPTSWTSTGALPGGLSFTSGVLSGTPNAAGTFPFSVTATNAGGTSAALAVSVNITAPSGPPVIQNTPPSTATTGTAYSFQYSATGAAGITYSTPGPLPSGITLTTGGLLSGTPATGSAGSYPFTVTATNGSGSVPQSVSIVVSAPVAPVLATLTIPLVGTVGVVYPTQTFVTSAGSAPIAWSIASGTQPAGLTLNPTSGVLSGTPTTAGTYTFAVQAANGTLPNGVTANYIVVISPAVNSPGGVSVEGYTIPYPVSKAAKTVGPSHLGDNGGGSTINAWSVSPTNCIATPPLTRLWKHNIDFADYARKVTNDYPSFGPNEALVYQFTADPTNLGIGSIYVTQGPYGAPAPTFVTISTTPCDFDVSKANANACYTSAAADNGFYYEITNAATGYGCKLVPNTTYYLNLRWQDSRSPNSDACASMGSASCGANIGIKKL